MNWHTWSVFILGFYFSKKVHVRILGVITEDESNCAQHNQHVWYDKEVWVTPNF